jgi:hypothetical protein
MKYIEQTTKEVIYEGLRKAYDILTVDEFWDIRGLDISDEDKCWVTKDKSCYYVYQIEEENFVYFALENKVQNIKGLYEVLLNLVYQGIPYIHFNGRKGRYDIIKNNFVCVFEDEKYSKNDGWDHLIGYAAHPENILRLVKRIK